MYEKQVRQYSNQLDIMMQTENKIRALQHDMKHHLIELLSLARESNNNLNIEEYILNMKEFISNHREYTHSGNKDVDSVLNYMIQQAEQKLKKVEYKISIPEELDMRSFDLNMILGNLLENAIEAAVNSTEKELSITIDYKKGILFLEVWNSYNGKIIKRNGHYMTTKENIASHGIGLENVKKVVENHNGTMDVLYDKNTFDIKIMLYTFKLRHKIYEFRNLQV
ncbi:MAG: ATP-binding protein [Hespellia sp.]|nr:ATP-binding protein [Hespellia sp.]